MHSFRLNGHVLEIRLSPLLAAKVLEGTGVVFKLDPQRPSMLGEAVYGDLDRTYRILFVLLEDQLREVEPTWSEKDLLNHALWQKANADICAALNSELARYLRARERFAEQRLQF
jgi:hypothetical protein